MFKFKLLGSGILAVLLGAGLTRVTYSMIQGAPVNVLDKGADKTGATDSQPAFQKAVNAAVANGNGRVVVPCGTYIVNTPISLAPTFFGLMVDGENKNCVTIKANAGMTAVFLYTDVSANGRFQFRNLTIDGNAVAQYGIKSTQFRYGELVDVTVQNAPTAGVQFAAGWDISVRNSEFFGNGDGFILADTQGNDLTFDKTLFTSNTGVGLRFVGGGPVTVRNGAVQGNAKGGIYFVGLGRPAVVDGVYFEANAATGIAFATPVKTVKADIIANGTSLVQSETNLNASFPSPNVTIRNCLFNETNTETAVYAVAGTSMSLRGNYNSGPTVPLLKTYGDSTIANVHNVEFSGNVGFTKDVDVDSITTQRSESFSTWVSDSVAQRINYAPRDVFKLSKVAVSSGTSVMKRGAAKFQGQETFDVDQGSGDQYGIVLDTTVNTELASQLIYISAWAKSSAVTAGPRLSIGAKSNTGSLAADTAWHHIEFADFAPAAGTVTIGFSKLGAVLGDIVTFSKVTIAAVGVPDRVLQPDITVPVRWSNTAAPTTGTWERGDVVWNSTSSISGGLLSWVCTVAGTPGTWVDNRSPGTSTFAALGAPANGTLNYCSDCTIANPCVGGGTGAIAKRLNGVWVCN